MRLTVIGCSGSFPGPDSPASCYLVEAPYDGGTYRLVLDLGNGAFGYLQRYVDPLRIDAVALSHLHADHCLDLASMYVQRLYHPDAPHPRVPVYGPSGTADRMARAYNAGDRSGMDDVFDFREWGDGPVRIGPFEVAVARVAHPVESYAIRVDCQGRALVYSGDTGPCDSLVRLARGADVLLAEASFVESRANPPDLHMTGRQAAEHAVRAGVARLLLTHVPPWTDPQVVLCDARPVSGNTAVEMAEPGATYDI